MNETFSDEFNESFRVGRVLRRSFSALFANFFRFMALALIVYIPYLLLLMSPVFTANSGPTAQTLTGTLGPGMLVFVLNYVATGAMIYGVFRQLGGQDVSIAECLSIGTRRLIPIVIVSIVVSILTGLATLLLIIPGIIVYTMFWVAVPAVVVERSGIGRALGRSRELTQNRRMQIFGIAVVLSLIGGGVGLISAGMAGAFASGMSPTTSVIMTSIVTTLITAATTALSAVASSVAYHDLRLEKEGVGIEDLLRVFE